MNVTAKYILTSASLGLCVFTAHAEVIWSEDFEGAALGAAAGNNQTIVGTTVQTRNNASCIVVDASTDSAAAIAFTKASGHFIRLSVADSNFSALRHYDNGNAIPLSGVSLSDTITMKVDLYIPPAAAPLDQAVYGFNPRIKSAFYTSNGYTYKDQAVNGTGEYTVMYTGPVSNFVNIALTDSPTSMDPFLFIEQEINDADDGTTTNFLYMDNIHLEIGVPASNSIPPLNTVYFSNLRANPVDSTPLIKWQHFGPGMSGYIDKFWINNGDPNAMYDALDMGNGQITLNRGEYWSTYRRVDGDGKHPNGVSGMDFSYQDPDFGLMIGKDMTYSTTDRGRSWQELVDTHPASGNSEMHSVIAVDPSDDDNWYIGAGHSWDIKGCHYNQSGIVEDGNFSEGFIMYSKDRGQSWMEVSSPFPSDSSFSCIIVDPRDSDIVYASCQHGVYKSTNGGVSWAKVPGSGLPYNQPRFMDSHYDAGTGEFLLYMVEITHYTISGSDIVTSGGIYRSADGGANWENLTGDLAIDMTQITSWGYLQKYYRAVAWWLEMDQSTFESSYNLPTSTFSQFGRIAVDPTNKDRIYLSHNTKHDYAFPPGNIWMTENGGTNWYAAAREGPYWINGEDAAYWNSRAIQPTGMNSTMAHVDLEHRDFDNTSVGTRFINCNQLGEVYTAFSQQIMRSIDHGVSWKQIDDDETEEGNGHWVGRGNSNLPGETFCLDTRTPGTYLWGSGEHGLWRNTNDGDKVYPGAIAVEQLTGQSIAKYDSTSMGSIAIHPVDANKIYTLQFRQTHRGELRYSPDNGASWQTLSTPVNFPGGNDVIFQHSLMLDHVNPDNMYFCVPFSEWVRWSGPAASNGRQVTGEPAFFGQGIYKSADGGASWNMVTNGLPGTNSVYRMAMDPVDPQIIYAALNKTHDLDPSSSKYYAPGGLYKTTDGGANWGEVALPTGVISVYSVKFQKATGNLYIGCGSQSDNGETGGGFMSQDGGATWQLLFDMPFVRHFAPSQADPNIIAVNVDKASSIGNRNPGAYVTIDGGANWHKINQHHGQPEGLRKIEPDPYDPDILWMSLHGTGFFRADISPLRTGEPVLLFWDWMQEQGTDSMFVDTDSDGFDNKQEFVADTNPSDPDSFLSVGLVPSIGTERGVVFNTAMNRLYAVDYSEDLTAGWNTLTNGVSGTGIPIEILDADGATNRFYRIHVEME